MLKVRLFANYGDTRSGGVEVFTRNLASSLAGLGSRVELVTVGRRTRREVSRGNLGLLQLRGIGSIGMPVLGNILAILDARIDIIHATIPNPFMSMIAACLSRITGRPLVVTVMSFPTRHGLFANFFNRRIIPLILAQSSLVVVPTYAFALHSPFRSGFTRNIRKVARIPFSVDLSVFRPGTPVEMRHNKDEKVILTVAVLDHQHWFKGIAYLIDAFDLVAKSAAFRSRLVIVGDGDMRATYERRCSSRGLGPIVSFLGEVPNTELPGIYNGSDVVVLPSISETESFGIVLAEAMACGKPVICSNVGGPPELTRGCGLIVEPGNPRLLADAITSILLNSTLAGNLSESGLSRSSLFSKEAVAKQYLRQYLLLNSGSHRPDFQVVENWSADDPWEVSSGNDLGIAGQVNPPNGIGGLRGL